MTATKQKKKSTSALGRLSALGPKEPWQVALYLPNRWDDLTSPINSFAGFSRYFMGDYVLLKGYLRSVPQVTFGNGAPRISGKIGLADNHVAGFSAFGDTRELQADITANSSDLWLFGKLTIFNEMYWLNDIEVVDPRWRGRFRPVYAGKAKVIGPEMVQYRVMSNLREAVPVAAEYLLNELELTREQLCKLLTRHSNRY